MKEVMQDPLLLMAALSTPPGDQAEPASAAVIMEMAATLR